MAKTTYGIVQAMDDTYAAGKKAAYEHAALLAEQRYFLALKLTPEAAKAVFQALPDAIRALASRQSEPST